MWPRVQRDFTRACWVRTWLIESGSERTIDKLVCRKARCSGLHPGTMFVSCFRLSVRVSMIDHFRRDQELRQGWQPGLFVVRHRVQIANYLCKGNYTACASGFPHRCPFLTVPLFAVFKGRRKGRPLCRFGGGTIPKRTSHPS